jgi:phosphoribosylanthranilate isomerase
MVNGLHVKVCGLTSVADAAVASDCGADYLGFILYPKSPRYVSLEAFKAMLPALPGLKKVAVVVYSSPDDLECVKDEGFDYVQLHFPNETPFFEAAMWTDIIPPERLWLAPRVPPGKDLDLAFVPLADTFLLDSYHPTKMGGSGEIGDWSAFARLRDKFRKVSWVLAGGLNPENIAAAVAASGARTVDVNSGVEASPGVKDHAKLATFFDALKQASAPK